MKLMTHVVIGYPTLADTISLVKVMEKAGAQMVELQIPFSDPLADGATIMQACEKALEQGTTVKDVFTMLHSLSQEVTIPRYLMAYYNTVLHYGVENFCKDAKGAHITGLIIPDMPIEEEVREHLFAYCKKYQLHNIRVVSPVSTQERLEKNAKVATGFIYATARQGITGAQEKLPKQTRDYLQRVKQTCSLPLAVGFGISTPLQIQTVAGIADIAVVGSAIIDCINKSDKKNMLKNVEDFIHSLNVVE